MILLGYTPAQWVLFFFLYSFLGWIWESSFVSIREHRWVNRGFLHGPLLPIYGFGAVSILLFTLPVAQNPLLIFLMGMTGATLLEYITGYAMERMFHVRYWDYSMYRWNLNGYICLPASLCWGVFSLAMVKLIHPLLGGWTASLPETLAVPAALTLAGLTTADMFVSLREAVDMRSLLSSLSESKRRIAWLQKRLEVQAAFAPNTLTRGVDTARQSGEAVKSALAARLQVLRDQRSRLLRTLDSKSLLSSAPDAPETARLIQKEFQAMRDRTDPMFRRTVRHLRRNPSIVSKRYGDALQDMEPLLDP